MVDTKQLIQEMSLHSRAVAAKHPLRHAIQLLVGLCLYMVMAQYWLLGVRADFAMQLERLLFVAELAMLLIVMVSATIAAAYAMYPDMYQKPVFLRMPYVAMTLLLLLMTIQIWLPPDARMVLPNEDSHTIECTIYIGLASLLPAACMIAYLRKGATVVPRHACALTILAATAMGAFTLRLCEPIDPASHQLVWHYLPNLVFAVLGALIGKRWLRW